jgi:hypothetical protein
MHLHHAAAKWRLRLREKVGDRGWAWAEASVYGGMLLLIIVNSGTPGEFIYFQF